MHAQPICLALGERLWSTACRSHTTFALFGNKFASSYAFWVLSSFCQANGFEMLLAKRSACARVREPHHSFPVELRLNVNIINKLEILLANSSIHKYSYAWRVFISCRLRSNVITGIINRSVSILKWNSKILRLANRNPSKTSLSVRHLSDVLRSLIYFMLAILAISIRQKIIPSNEHQFR